VSQRLHTNRDGSLESLGDRTIVNEKTVKNRERNFNGMKTGQRPDNSSTSMLQVPVRCEKVEWRDRADLGRQPIASSVIGPEKEMTGHRSLTETRCERGTPDSPMKVWLANCYFALPQGM